MLKYYILLFTLIVFYNYHYNYENFMDLASYIMRSLFVFILTILYALFWWFLVYKFVLYDYEIFREIFN